MFGVQSALTTSTTTYSNPKTPLQNSARLHHLLSPLCHIPSIFLHICLPFHLASSGPSELLPGCPRPHHHHPQISSHEQAVPSHCSPPVQREHVEDPVVPVANCPRFTCAGPEMVSEQDGPSNRGLISLTACLALLQNVCVSNLSSLYSWSRHVLVPKRIGTVCGMFFCIYRAHLRHSFPPP